MKWEWEWALAHAKKVQQQKIHSIYLNEKRFPRYIQFQICLFPKLLTTTDHTSIQDDQWYDLIYRWPHLFPYKKTGRDRNGLRV